jgi:hypothetical protein
MPIRTQIVCDGCQDKKQDTNHWYTLTIRKHAAEVALLALKPDGRPYVEGDGLQQYYCGRYCLHEAINKWMDDLTQQAQGQPRSDPSLTTDIAQDRENPAKTEDSGKLTQRAILLKRGAPSIADNDELPT